MVSDLIKESDYEKELHSVSKKELKLKSREKEIEKKQSVCERREKIIDIKIHSYSHVTCHIQVLSLF